MFAQSCVCVGNRRLSFFFFACLFFLFFCFSAFFPQTALELNGVLNSSKKQALFHHHFRVLARVPGLVSLFFWHPVPSSFPGSG